MGWTFQIPKHFKYNKGGFQCIDRKAECDAIYSNGGKWRVLKSAMVGSTYYAAVDNGKDVFCGVVLTAVKKNEFGCGIRGFGYKCMDETMCPYYYDCPTSILDLLSPTDNEWANEWREKCRKHKEAKTAARKDVNALKRARRISMTFQEDYGVCKAGETITLTLVHRKNRGYWLMDGTCYYIRRTEVIRLGYKVLEEAA